MRILLCDDDPMILVQMEKYLKEYFQKAHLRVPDIASYTSGDALLRSESTAEIAFLDVEIPGLSGIYTGEKLKKKNPSIKIFILTSYMDYLDEAMKFHVFRYLSKPIEKARLFRNVKEALYQIEMETRPVAIETKDGVIVRQAEDIVFVETERHKTKIVTIDAVYEVNSPPTHVERPATDRGFLSDTPKLYCEYEVCRGVYQRYGEVEFARRTDLFCIFDETAIQRF